MKEPFQMYTFTNPLRNFKISVSFDPEESFRLDDDDHHCFPSYDIRLYVPEPGRTEVSRKMDARL